MNELLQNTWTMAVDPLFYDGVIAVLAVATAAPLIGTFVVLKRMPMLCFAVPATANLGQTLAFYFFALSVGPSTIDFASHPNALTQIAVTGLTVCIAIVALILFDRGGRSTGIYAGIVFLLASTAREFIHSRSAFFDSMDQFVVQGQVFSVDEAMRNRLLVTCVVVAAIALLLKSRIYEAAFDPDQQRLRRMYPAVWGFVSLLLLGVMSTVGVPAVGPNVLLTFFLIPAAILRSSSPSLVAYPVLAILAGLLGAILGFILSFNADLPIDSSMVIGVSLASVAVALFILPVRLFVARSVSPDEVS